MAKPDSKKNGKKTVYLRYLLGCVAVLTLSGLWYWNSLQPERVHRQHSKTVPKEFEYLTRRIDFSLHGDTWLSRQEAEQDLDELEWLLENRYSYLMRKGVDYKAALDSIRGSLDSGINRSSFGYQLGKLIALFGDGHSRVASSSVRPKSLCSMFLPFLVEESDGGFVAFKPDRSAFIDPNFPFLRGVDGLPVSTWLKAAGQWVARGSPQYQRYHTIRNLRYVECFRKELGLGRSGSIQVELESVDGSSTRRIKLPLAKKCPVYGFWPRPEAEIKSLKDVRVESRILQGDIGYLRILVMLDRPEFLEGLVEAMNHFKDTDGLIIDIRSNGGGSRAPLRVLFPFFMTEDEPPKVLNIAAYRLGHRKDILDARWLYPEDWKGWSSAERAAIKKAAKTFEPEWNPPQNEFSDWHYFVIGPTPKPKHYHYDRPVIILMNTTNFSASDIFLGAFRGWRNVTLMGTASGGGSGRYQRYRLHHSLINIGLSSMASFQPNGKLYDGNGIQPDVIIEPIPTDFIRKTDSVLQAAKNSFNKLKN
jgi:hypothetical protein